MLYNVLPSRVEAFGISVALVGVLLSANRIVRLVSNFVAAWAIERFGIRGPLLASVLLALGTTVTYGTAPWFWVLLLARLLMSCEVFVRARSPGAKTPVRSPRARLPRFGCRDHHRAHQALP